MADKPDLLRRPLYLYSLPADVLDSLVLAEAASGVDAQPGPDAGAADAVDAATDMGASEQQPAMGGPACALCGLAFSTTVDQRGHVKSDLHHYNLKQKMRGASVVTEADFERLVGSLDESLSGSESEESEEEEGDGAQDNVLATLLKRQAVLAEKQRQAAGESEDEGAAPRRRTPTDEPLLWFRSALFPKKYIGVYRALFTPEELAEKPTTDGLLQAIRSRQLASIGGVVNAATPYTGRHVFLCMIGGGHFAAMVVALAPRKARAGSVPMNREATVLAHKTFHRYTTRRKQGGSQSANDAAKGAAHSAGSSLRRYNEQALVDDVRALLGEWKGLLDTAELLFVRATGNTNRRTLFGPYDGQVLQARDPRLRGFPFTTRRPTQKEMMRAFIELTRLKVREEVEVEEVKTDKPKAAKEAKPKPKVAKLSEEEETALMHTAQLQALVRRSKVPALLAYLQANGLSAAGFRFAPGDTPQHHHAPTLLHLAAAQNAPALVMALVVRADADPTVRNGDGKTPFELAGDRATRDAFRVARSEKGSGIDWEAARVPAAMTRAEAEQREAREKQAEARQEAERRRAEEERLAAEAAAARPTAGRKKLVTVGVAKSAQEKRDEETRGLTPEQRQRLERERRARAAEERMRRMGGR